MPTRQPSATTGKPKKPRLQVVVTEQLCAQVEALAEVKGWSVSRTAEYLIEQGLVHQGQTSRPTELPAAITTTPDQAEAKFQKLIEIAKLAGVL
jgi:hypothetical protein